MNSNQFFKSTLACAVALGMASAASVAMAQSVPSLDNLTFTHMQRTSAMEKTQEHKTEAMMKKDHFVACYGINAAYKNDCKSPGHSCAGQDSKARDPGAFVAVPSGLCKKIAGGSLTAA